MRAARKGAEKDESGVVNMTNSGLSKAPKGGEGSPRGAAEIHPQ